MSGPVRRTVHACVQCRERKTKCGGVTEEATCVACSSRRVTCSFHDEARDPRFNPYLRVRTREPTEQLPQPLDSEPVDLQEELRRLRNELEALKAGQQHRDLSSSAHNPPLLGSDPVNTWSDPIAGYESTLLTSDAHQIVFRNLSQLEQGLHDAPNQPIPNSESMDDFMESLPTITPTPPRNDFQSLTSRWTQPGPSSHPSPDTPFSGPMRVLQDLGVNVGFDLEVHDPIARQIITLGEASLAFKTFFEHCHLNAPFLDPTYDADMGSVRSRSMALLLNIVVVAARFWSHKSRRDSWLHPKYTRLVSLLDAEMSRLTLRSRPGDICVETVNAWMIYSHWQPIDVTPGSATQTHRSRFSESSVWQCLGLAIRWATLLGLDQTAHMPFLDDAKLPTNLEIRSYRTMLYLTESDHYLALSARKPPTLNALPVCQALPRFLRGRWALATDARLAALMRVVEVSSVMGSRAGSEESVEAFNIDVDDIERRYFEGSSSTGSQDIMRQHFPFTSLRWYRLAFASTLLPAMCNWSEARGSIRSSVDWACQILYHLSSTALTTTFEVWSCTLKSPLEPNAALVSLLSFAIDQYYVVIAYTAAFLVLAWQSGAVDCELRAHTGDRSIPSQTCTLYRLVELGSRTLSQCAPSRGHPGTRYAEFLTGMTKIIMTEPMSTGRQLATEANQLDGDGPMWDQDWVSLWQDSGLDQNWLFSSVGEA